MGGKGKVQTLVPRISQLDAIEFDYSINDILSGQLLEIQKFLRPGLVSQAKPEIRLLVNLFIFKNSLWKDSSTFGQQLLSLKYGDIPRKNALVYLLFNTALPYAKDRYDESYRGRSRTVRGIVDKITNIIKLGQLVNLLAFFKQGVYPTLVDRLLDLRHYPTKPPNRGVVYDYMMRELLWHTTLELMKYTLPLINVRALQRWLKSWLGQRGRGVQVPAPMLDLTTKCAVCNARPYLPCRISLFCAHVACYVCLQGYVLSDEKFCCPQCGEVNTATSELQFIK